MASNIADLEREPAAAAPAPPAPAAGFQEAPPQAPAGGPGGRHRDAGAPAKGQLAFDAMTEVDMATLLLVAGVVFVACHERFQKIMQDGHASLRASPHARAAATALLAAGAFHVLRARVLATGA